MGYEIYNFPKLQCVILPTDFYSEESVNNQGLECLRFLNEVISDFDAVRFLNKSYDIKCVLLQS